MNGELRPLERLLLWPYERGGLAYDLLCALMLAFLLAAPARWLGDPLAGPW